MPRVKTTPPPQDKQKGQRSILLPEYLTRWIPVWQNPSWQEAEWWRTFVAMQPIAVICRDTLTSNILDLNWKIEPRDSEQRDELKSEIRYYEKFIANTGDYDYAEMMEWLLKDAMDIPFGGGAEIGREGDNPNGRVVWLELLDGGTLFPTYNRDWPVGQATKENPTETVYFPRHAINRMYLAPRTELRRKGWGMPPPEKIYLAMELLVRGDRYYANLLLDTPQVGILDLGDMEQTAAQEWVKSWREMLVGIDPFKIPVLYQHTTKAEFIPFTRNPTEIMFDKATHKYSSIVAAGYGMSLSDVGVSALSGGGDTMAGTIRQERQTRRSGLARLKQKTINFWNKILPEDLKFVLIDLDDETSVAMGRARLATTTALAAAIEKRMFLPNEGRQQMIADGLINISIPESVEGGDEFPDEDNNFNERTNLLGKPIAPSQGGYGEVKSDILSDRLNEIVKVEDIKLRKVIRSILPYFVPQLKSIYTEAGNSQEAVVYREIWSEWYEELWDGVETESMPEIHAVSDLASNKLDELLSKEPWDDLEIDTVLFADDLLDLFSQSRDDKLWDKVRRQYEVGEIESLDGIVFPDDKAMQRKFKSGIKKIINEIKGDVYADIKKSILKGVKNYLLIEENSHKILSDVLDIDLFMNDNVIVNFVRAELFNMQKNMLKRTADKISDLVDKLLEEV